MGFTQKVDVLDMIIEVLRDHEKNIDGLIDRLEKAVSMVEQLSLR